jgi:hypothetical protein
MRTPLAVGLALTVLFSFTACDDGGTTPLPPPGNTPAQVLEELELAFNDLDAELLERLLDTDFTFHFDEDDVGKDVGGYIIPESWDKEDFLAACARMFSEAYSVDLTVSTANVGDPSEGAAEFTAENVPIDLLVMVDPQNGFQANGFCDFAFVNDGSSDADNWIIIGWRDYTSDELYSIGSILAWFCGKPGT